tara:strand:- start:8462 stop:10555 length:2094 start_codon:yes stop_codon:yes gene_type:complete
MAYDINSSLTFGIDRSQYAAGTLNRNRRWENSYSVIASVNEPLIFSVRWNGLNQMEEPSALNYDSTTSKGDVVNVIFDIHECANKATVGTYPTDWTLVASIRKSRDIRNIGQMDRIDGGDGVQVIGGHIFTVDISEICKDLLSYSLIPHGKGTWATGQFGGLNGDASQGLNLFYFIAVNKFIITKNGAFRRIRVSVRTEIIDGDGIIREATTANSKKSSKGAISIINSAPDFDTNNIASVNSYAGLYLYGGYGITGAHPHSMMTNARNTNWDPNQVAGPIGTNLAFNKPVRMDENMEPTQFIIGPLYNVPEKKTNPTGTDDLVRNAYIRVGAYNHAGAPTRHGRLFDWTQNLTDKTTVDGILNVYERSQYNICSQNVSPVFINANIILDTSTIQDIWENGGTPYTRSLIDAGGSQDQSSLFLNDDISYYSVEIVYEDGITPLVPKGYSEKRWFKIDRERMLNTGDDYSYAGIYYTELSAITGATPNIRCKGLLWNEDSPSQDFFRVYWLNKAGGIDSYTIKGNKSISYNNEKDIIQRKEPDRFDYQTGVVNGADPYPSANAPVHGSFRSDTMGGADVHKGGIEVLNINATKSGRVTTRPLNRGKAEWLREILTSPNVWTEVNTQMPLNPDPAFKKIAYRSLTDITSGLNMDGRTPNNFQYVPIIITNSSVDVYDNEKGLVTMEFEYTHSHAVVTQRN